MTSPLTPAERALLARHMAAMSADPAGVVAFLDDFGERLRGVVRHHLVELTRRDLARDADEVDGLVIDTALVLAERAGAWDPHGALPWVWAERAIRAGIARSIGHARAAVDLDDLELGACGVAAVDLVVDGLGIDADANGEAGADGQTERPANGPPRAGPTGGELVALAGRVGDPRVGLLVDAIGRAIADPATRDVYVEFRLQKLTGDPSPACTLAPRYGLSVPNVRQIASRSHRRVRAVIAADDRYESLRDIGWVAA